MNAIHLLFVQGNVVNTLLFNFLIKQKSIEIDSKDWLGFTPFFKIFKNNVKHQPEILETFLKRGVNIDIENSEGFTPFLYTFKQRNYKQAEMLIDYKANINSKSKKGDFALKYAVERREFDKVKYLIQNGAEPLMKDLHNRNLLHIAHNSSPNSSNADLKIEKLLISEGVGMNDKDI